MKKFRKVYVEITNACNLSCSFCQKSKRSPEVMSLDLFQNILQQIKHFTDYVYLHVKGEPLLHPDIDKILDLCHDHKIKAVIVTNGTLIKKAEPVLLQKEAVRQINFSLHCFDQLTKEFELSYLPSIFSFTKTALQKTTMNISLRIWTLQHDNQISTSNKQVLESIQTFFSIPYSLEEKLKSDHVVCLTERLYLNTDYQFKWPQLKNPLKSNTGFCQALRDHVAILVDGTVVPCCLDGEGLLKLGDITKQNFVEIIQAKRAVDIYNSFSNSQAIEDLCRTCTYKDRFNH